MIGIITYISVMERTKEIGILRAIGASKRNVSSMFNAETIIIGFTSGALGVGITWLLCIPINAIIQHLTGLPGLAAYLPWQVAVILVAISMLLTVSSGIMPSRSAAKKDPVVALRTE
jgi:putative ABC transport system permease protein